MNNRAHRDSKFSSATLLTTLFLISSFAIAKGTSNYKGSGSITQGFAKTVEANIFECKNGRSRVAGIGEVTDSKGKSWTVPVSNNYATAAKAVDLYEECADITPKSIAEVDQDSVPVVVVDPEGEEITGYILPTTTLSSILTAR